jgi:membrane-associated phospholipid phosphatase
VTSPTAARPRLLPPELHRALALTAALAVLGLAALSIEVAGHRLPTRLDRLLLRPSVPTELGLPELLDAAALLIPPLMPLAVAALAVFCWHGGQRRAALFCVIGPATAELVTMVLKPLLARPAGAGGGWMFPSGHVTAVSAVAVTVALLLGPGGVLRDRMPRLLLLATAAAVVAAVGATALGTILARYHHPTDVLGAALVALATVPTVAALIDSLPPHRGEP